MDYLPLLDAHHRCYMIAFISLHHTNLIIFDCSVCVRVFFLLHCLRPFTREIYVYLIETDLSTLSVSDQTMINLYHAIRV